MVPTDNGAGPFRPEDYENQLLHGDATKILPRYPEECCHLVLTDIPYGISYDDWDVLHDNTNSALLGASPAQRNAGSAFQRRGKPINGWSEADRQIPLQYQQWCAGWGAECLRILKPGGSMMIFAGRRFAHRCSVAMEDAGFSFKDMIAWDKEKAAHRAQRLSVVFSRRGDEASAEAWEGWRLGNLRPVFEPVLWFVKPYKIGATIADNVLAHEVGAWRQSAYSAYNEQHANILKVSAARSESGLHPTQKPVKLMKALIELTTKPGQLVMDPFAGSGTTLAAAQAADRRYSGIEINETYVKTARQRLNVLF